MNIAGGAFITAQALLIQRLFPMPLKLDGMIIGAIMPLVPGMAFTNAIRDIADSDFLSGYVYLFAHDRRAACVWSISPSASALPLACIPIRWEGISL